MTQEQLQAFLAKVKGNSSLQDKLTTAKSPEEVVGIAKEHGYEFTADKINQLTEEELATATGSGKPRELLYSQVIYSDSFCGR